jgi:hypothetical protein
MSNYDTPSFVLASEIFYQLCRVVRLSQGAYSSFILHNIETFFQISGLQPLKEYFENCWFSLIKDLEIAYYFWLASACPSSRKCV